MRRSKVGSLGGRVSLLSKEGGGECSMRLRRLAAEPSTTGRGSSTPLFHERFGYKGLLESGDIDVLCVLKFDPFVP